MIIYLFYSSNIEKRRKNMIGYKNWTDHISHVVLATFVHENIFNKIIEIEEEKKNK